MKTKPWESRYHDSEFRTARSQGLHPDDLAYQMNACAQSTNWLAWLEDERNGAQGHPLTAHAVVVSDVAWEEDARVVRDFLRQHRLRTINSGWSKHGFVINFRDAQTASKFRLLYGGDTQIV